MTAEDLEILRRTDGRSVPFEPALNVLYAGSSPYRSALLIRESCTTTIQIAPVASGLEMVKNPCCVKQEGHGLLI